MQNHFVDSFDNTSTRHELFKGFLQYNRDLQKVLENYPYTQWIDGSFISKKVSPRDIDLVNLIDYQIVDTFESQLSPFLSFAGKRNYGVDAYVIRIYPTDHKYYSRTETDLLYWQHWFSKSRKNRKKQTFPKGFIELKH